MTGNRKTDFMERRRDLGTGQMGQRAEEVEVKRIKMRYTNIYVLTPHDEYIHCISQTYTDTFF